MPTKPKTFRPHGQPSKQESRRAYDRKRDDDKPWRRWYKLARWVKASKWFLRHNPICVDCEATGEWQLITKGNPSCVDHEEPHRGDYDKFWDVTNWRNRCKHHHDRKTASGR